MDEFIVKNWLKSIVMCSSLTQFLTLRKKKDSLYKKERNIKDYLLYSIKAQPIQKTFPCGQNLIAFWITIMYSPLPTGPFQTWHSLEGKKWHPAVVWISFFLVYTNISSNGCIRRKLSYKCNNSEDVRINIYCVTLVYALSVCYDTDFHCMISCSLFCMLFALFSAKDRWCLLNDQL